MTAVFQDFIRFERTLRENVAPGGAPDGVIRAALEAAGAEDLAYLRRREPELGGPSRPR